MHGIPDKNGFETPWSDSRVVHRSLLFDPTQSDPPAHGPNTIRPTEMYETVTRPDPTYSYSSKWRLHS